MPVGVSRRGLLQGLAGVVAGSALSGCLADDDATASHPALSLPESHSTVAFLRVTTDNPAATRDVMKTLADRAERAGGESSAALGFGASVFTRAGLQSRRPRQLVEMPTFVGDILQPERVTADLVLQVGASSATKARAAMAQTLAGVSGISVAWSTAAFRPENTRSRGRALTRNIFGFTEGHANPDMRKRADVDAMVLVGRGGGEPAWAAGGSYLVTRVIKVSRDLWDADTVAEQEAAIGRRRDGRWLDGTDSMSEPDFAHDPEGRIAPLDSHVRRANPRKPGDEVPRLVRRSWSYTTTDATGSAEQGLLFMCYQADVTRGFAAVQTRLTGQRLDRYVLATGGGYFFVPPPQSTRWQSGLFA